MDNKTPVSTLHELCTANQTEPMFNLIYDGTGSINPVFKYEVCMNIRHNAIRAVGSGRNKKEAKHDTAKNALEKLSELNISLTKSKAVCKINLSTKLPEQETGKGNCTDAINNLMDICDKRRLPVPSFELIEDSGPPHARKFTMTCTVASIQKNAESATKKSAKQLSAFYMIDLLHSLENSEIVNKGLAPKTNIDVNAILKERQILIHNNNEVFDDPFKDYDKDKCDEARKILHDGNKSNKDKTVETLQALDIKYEITIVASTIQKQMYLLSSVGVLPEFCIAGYSFEELYYDTNDFLNALLL